MSGGHVKLESLTKRFDQAAAVQDISLEIQAGEFFSLLGPSGCGKTTTLRMVAGFEPPTNGKILLDGVDVAGLPPHRRNVNTVFQSYALFPFLNVAENVAFGMKYKSVPKAQLSTRVAEALEMVQLSGYEKRRPNQLSGGQQQRVALARALVLRPAVLLLDEPLGALDAKIRKQLRLELKALQEEVGITFVFVTHDQEEALSMSDRVAVMNGGRVEHIGTPEAVYESPATVFVADFLGVSNLMDAQTVDRGPEHCTVSVGDFRLRAACGDLDARGAVKVVARPERVELLEHGSERDNCLPGMVERTVYVGATLQVMVRLATGAQLQASITNTGHADGYQQGTPVSVHVPADALRIVGDSPDPSSAGADDHVAADAPAAAPAGTAG
ncbi:MAG TPA: ABC transporter ATP-binding protein [Solirubrobacteraceae bacterium]|jgi:spermidine/putrescine transport system ATP-binding protein|nr:ABC transporter ATP-binding protein [Solirubrobacteraceae bacterium]